MRLRASNVTISLISAVILMAVFSEKASATAQWARKYGESCTTCHTAFPRLNYYGERFMRNGYQNPDDATPDGNTRGKKALNDITFIDRVSNLLGFRLNVTPVQWEANALKDNGKDTDRWTLGNANWIQFFVAGSIAENISFFTEMAWDDREFHYSWYKLGFHNLFDTTLANVVIGNLPSRDYGAYPNRLRIMGPIKGDVFGVKSSQGANKAANDENALNSSGSRPGVQFYGYKGPVMAWVGASPGDNGEDKNLGTDKNDELHYWAGLRLEVTEAVESIFEGSAISVWAYQGTDTANFAGDDASTADVVEIPYDNEYGRYSVEGTIRVKDFELMAAYVMGEDDNWNLDESDTDIDFDGVSLVAGYMQTLKSGKLLHYALQYDKVNSSDVASLEKEFVSPSISYFPVENMRIGLYARIDTENSGDDANHKVFANIRTMF